MPDPAVGSDAMPSVRAVAFDFNGTLSDDEPILLSVYQEMFAEHGRPLTPADYYGTLAGHSEEEIIGRWLAVDGEALAGLVEDRIERYLERCGEGESISQAVRDAVAYAAERTPVAVVSGAFRREIEPILHGAGLAGHVTVLVSADDVERGKPAPDGYERALDMLGGLAAGDVVAFEDTEAGVASAKAAGLRCVGVVGTHPAERLGAADELVEVIDVALVQRLLT